MLKVKIHIKGDVFEFEGSNTLAEIKPLIDLFLALHSAGLSQQLQQLTASLKASNDDFAALVPPK